MEKTVHISSFERSGPIILLFLICAIGIGMVCAGGATKAQAQSLQSLTGQFEKYRKARNYKAAEQVATRMVSIAAKRYGKNHFNYGLSVNYLAIAYAEQNRMADAIPHYETAVRLLGKKLGASHGAVIDTSENLVRAYSSVGSYDKALPLAKKVFDARVKTLDRSSVPYADKLYDFATLQKSGGEFKEAASNFEQVALVYEEKLDAQKPGLANTLHNLGSVYGALSRYEDAIATLERSLSAYENSLGAKHPFYAYTLEQIAGIYKAQGQYEPAIENYNASLKILAEALGTNHVSYANTLNNLANVHKARGEFGKAIPMYKKTLDILDSNQMSEHPNYGNTLNNLGVIYNDTGRHEEALALYERSLAVKEKAWGKSHPIVADTINNIGDLYRSQAQYEEAIERFKRALEIYEAKLGSGHPRVAVALDNIGFSYFGQNQYGEAAKFHKRALAIREKALGDAHPDVGTSTVNLANAYFGNNRLDEAIANYEKALAIFENTLGGAHSRIAIIHGNLAEVYKVAGKYDEALSSSRRAMSVLTESRSRARAGQLVGGNENAVQLGNIYSNFAVLAHDAAEQDPSRRAELGEEALQAGQQYSSTSVTTALAQMAARFAADDQSLGKTVRQQQDLKSKWQDLDKALSGELSKPLSARDPAKTAEIRKQRRIVEEELEAVAARLNEKFPQYKELTDPKPLKVSAIQRLLGQDEALVTFVIQDRNSYIWAVTGDRMIWRKLGADTGEKKLSSRVASLRKDLQIETLQQEGKFFNLQTAYQLYVDLLGPVEDVIKDKKNLLLVPVGSLTSLPFNVLITNEPPKAVPDKVDGYREAHWLIKRHAVTILPAVSSLRALREFAAAEKAKEPFIGYGDPDFGGNRGGFARGAKVTSIAAPDLSSVFTREGLVDVDMLTASLPQLPDTADELRHVAERLGAENERVRLGKVATEQDVKQADLEAYRIVYFATHGLVAGDLKALGSSIAEPALALTVPGKATALDDGLLTASEVAKLKLNADWVVLSACNTAAGDKAGAEALSGLAKAFIYAGARSLLVSHWPVVSTAAVSLTTAIFDLQAKDASIGRSEALRQSMVALLNNKDDPLNAYPSVWAPFIIVGDGGI